MVFEQIRHDNAILIRGHRQIGRAAPFLNDILPIENSRLDVGVANVHHKYHGDPSLFFLILIENVSSITIFGAL
jgi:hypothetical protein